MLALTDRIVDSIGQIGEFRKPNEAVGIIVKQKVFELPNRGLDPQHGFTIHTDDIRITLENNAILMHQTDWDNMVLWHTHPGGSIGPSPMDMRTKVVNVMNLVIALTDDGPVPTIY